MNAILRPALHTLWQSFAAALAIWWTASGAAGVHSITDVSTAQRFALSALLAVLAALCSAALHTLREYGPTLLRAEAKNEPAIGAALDALLGDLGEYRAPASGTPPSK